MKLNYRKICRSNEGVSEVIGGLLLITIVVSFMTSLILISTNYIDMQENIVNSNMEACKRFIDYLNNLFIGNAPPVISDPHPTPGEINVPKAPVCSVFVSDSDDSQLFVTFFFYPSGDSDSVVTPEGYHKESFVVGNNTVVKCVDSLATTSNTVYYWKVSVSDGHQTVNSDKYYFTTKAADPSNAPPKILEPIWPKDNVTGVQLSPPAYLFVSDTDSDSLTVNFYLLGKDVGWDEGSVNVDSSSHGPVKVTHNLAHATGDGMQYYWFVIVSDGTNVVRSDNYYFYTLSISTPT